MPQTRQTNLNRADKWIFGVLSGSPVITSLVGTRVYRHKAPVNTAFPCLIFACQTATDRNVVGSHRLLTQATYAVRAVTRVPGTEDAADAAAAAADSALIAAAVDSHMMCIERISPLNRSYTLDGVDYEERGGLYRVWLRGEDNA